MTYDITTKTAPAMPKIGKGMEILKLLLPQLSKDMQETIAPLLFDSLASHMSETEFMYPDLTWKEICGMITGIVTRSAGGKGQLQRLVEAIMRVARQHDEMQLQKLVEWQRPSSRRVPTRRSPCVLTCRSGFRLPTSPTLPSYRTPWDARSSDSAHNTSTCPRWKWQTVSAADTARYPR